MASLPSVRGALDVVGVPGRVVLDVARRVEQLLASVEALATGVASLEREFRGLRGDMREVIDGVERLRGEVRGMSDGVHGIRGATSSIEGRIDTVAESLERLDVLTARLQRLSGGRRARGPERPERAA